ncbi:pyridoxal phosphate-dependent transferase [Dimargaris cristalligena]|uniref:Aspartate aminotransferase n=1 Tax=Dimargaris cristalligena TaxID=215637 RepID=A0A4Q0A3F1_9FUNG|nr:pyridoxal phosphate-dependent transferase [Dimargaris cristalligena]|eukprot:RKP39942.1 pyridoxal phosphate-dependent transferase [Dimargaris cristalligena]
MSEVSAFADVPLAPPDAILNLSTMYKSDTSDQKVDLGVGAYRDNDGKPWVLPVVRKAEKQIADAQLEHEYLPIAGLKSFTDAAAVLLLGSDNPAIVDQRVVSFQTISGTGANFLGATFLSRFYPKGTLVLLSDPTWANHKNIFNSASLETQDYKYYDPATLGLDLAGMLSSLQDAPSGSIVLLHACAHNPTGVDPTQEQWKRIADVMQAKGHFPFFDCAYQGFASGDLDRDAFAIRYFIERGFECSIAQSFAKNLGLYGERVGCYHVVTRNAAVANQVRSQIARASRAIISNPPLYGARVASTVLNSPTLLAEWKDSLRFMSGRILDMRAELRRLMLEKGTPGNWDHITSQIGMFTFTGLNPEQVNYMVKKHHIYMTKNGRISMAGLSTHNVQHVAQAIDDVVRNY